MRLTLRDEKPVLLAIDADPDKTFDQICRDNPDLRIEQTEKGEILVMSPAGNESSDRNNELSTQLRIWAKKDGRGRTFDSNTVFRLSDKSKRGPDAAWVSNTKLSSFSLKQRKGFLPLAPEFIIELRSQTDRIRDLHKKMEIWIRNGVELGWLIDADNRRVWIYKQASEPFEQVEPAVVFGEGPIAGFQLVMEDIYRGLDF